MAEPQDCQGAPGRVDWSGGYFHGAPPGVNAMALDDLL